MANVLSIMDVGEMNPLRCGVGTLQSDIESLANRGDAQNSAPGRDEVGSGILRAGMQDLHTNKATHSS